MADIRFRNASVGDAQAIRKCIDQAYAAARRDIPDLPDVSAGIEEDIRDHWVSVAEIGDALVGVIVFARIDRAIMVFNIAVSTEAQGQGVARQLLEIAERTGREQGCNVLRLATHRQMQDTWAVYRHLGWREEETDGNKVRMFKSLN